jgi:hypothetical protein
MGVLYAAIHSNEKQESLFQLETHLYREAKDVPFSKLMPGKGG